MTVRLNREDFAILYQVTMEAGNVSSDRLGAANFVPAEVRAITDFAKALIVCMGDTPRVSITGSEATHFHEATPERPEEIVAFMKAGLLVRWRPLVEFLISLHSPYELFLRTGFRIDQFLEVMEALP